MYAIRSYYETRLGTRPTPRRSGRVAVTGGNMDASFPRIGIAGAGAIGCTLAARLAGSGRAVSLLARGATLAALRRDGVRLRDRQGEHQTPVNASDRAAALGEQDLVRTSYSIHDTKLYEQCSMNGAMRMIALCPQ